MGILLKSGQIYADGTLFVGDVLVSDGVIKHIATDISIDTHQVIDCNGLLVTAGLVDVHVHLREPGYSHKETIATGTRAAARGGYTAVCSMPNLSPAPDTVDHLKIQQDLIAAHGVVKVYPYGCITINQQGGGTLTDMVSLKSAGAIGFTDDGKGVQLGADMKTAMETVAQLGGIIAAHCEDESLIHGGYIHDGDYCKSHGHTGICSESEWGQVARDIELVRQTKCPYHVCHISTKETVALIRDAKAEGLPVTCETAPHYLVMCDEEIQDDGRFKMNPPIRAREDQLALIKGVQDGTIDVIATDHAPHSEEEKSRGLKGSAMGVVGLETAFAILYEKLVKTQIITIQRLLELFVVKPREIFHIEGLLSVNESADIAVFDLGQSYDIDSKDFVSMGHATPLDGMRATGETVLTMVNGKIVWQRDKSTLNKS